MQLFNSDRLRLLITDACNLSCTYCHNEGQFGHKNYMSLQEVQELATWISDQNIFIKSLIISGGEPSIHPQLLSIVEAVRESAKSLSMVTNGLRLTHATIDALADGGMKYIKFGIDAVDSYATKGPLDRDVRRMRETVIDNALYAAQIMPGSHLNTVVSSFNSERIRSVLEFCDSNHIGVKFLELIEVRPNIHAINPFAGHSGHAWFASLFAQVRDVLSQVEYNPRVKKFYAKTPSGQTVQFSENFCVYGSCSSLWTRVDTLRQLVPCIQRPVTRPLTLNEEGLAQTADVNREMTDVAAWPCGVSGIRQDPVNDGAVDVNLEDGSTLSVPLTAKTSCVG